MFSLAISSMPSCSDLRIGLGHGRAEEAVVRRDGGLFVHDGVFRDTNLLFNTRGFKWNRWLLGHLRDESGHPVVGILPRPVV